MSYQCARCVVDIVANSRNLKWFGSTPNEGLFSQALKLGVQGVRTSFFLQKNGGTHNLSPGLYVYKLILWIFCTCFTFMLKRPIQICRPAEWKPPPKCPQAAKMQGALAFIIAYCTEGSRVEASEPMTSPHGLGAYPVVNSQNYGLNHHCLWENPL